MVMEGVRVRYSLAAALLLLTLVVLAAASASGGAGAGDDAAAAVEDEKRCHPRADEPYMLVAFHNKDNDEEVRLLADQRSEQQVSSVSAFANRSGNWFYAGLIRQEGKGERRGVLPLPQPNDRTAEGLWDTLGVLVNSKATASDDDSDNPAADDDDDDEGYYYMVVGLQTSGGDKIRLLVVVTDHQRYFFVTGFARGFFRQPNWSFRDGERHRLLLPTTLGGNGSSHSHGGGSSHAEAVASNVLAALMEDAKACCG